ncbi:hypothetical protein PTTG_09860 [Puccinia triticina 1-1 BBBD Race 1]|uniref:Uncharacterized protein n=2 Tax=Puccinia triticina TaxID=208348 RepID=A0A0C4F9I0_PUCT1|nr:uncharacterized protein PtA15_14A330 [Puccinia triticina]OAV88543.1 hypothetical protein PTTG_09860 [Puccinia triticina 1-1 BBBD Race 1]WAQ91446.1 hypothetical protein PtA15_14A330 [Puccinia triticina]WAR62251.1 hypothetical protein PtB15_14B346 [Puccinia triticina]
MNAETALATRSDSVALASHTCKWHAMEEECPHLGALMAEAEIEIDELANNLANLSNSHQTPKPAAPRLSIQPSLLSKLIASFHSSSLQPPPLTCPSPTPHKTSYSATWLQNMLKSTSSQFSPATPHRI